MAVAFPLHVVNPRTGLSVPIRIEKFTWQEPTGPGVPPHRAGAHTRRQSSAANQRAGQHNQVLRRHQRVSLEWTHAGFCSPEVDVRDGVTRVAGSNALTHADGDQLTVPALAGSPAMTFRVVFVAGIIGGEPNREKKLYLVRDTVTW